METVGIKRQGDRRDREIDRQGVKIQGDRDIERQGDREIERQGDREIERHVD